MEVVAVREAVVPFSIDSFVWFKVIVVLFTLIVQEASAPLLVARIVTLPAFFAVTFPAALTEAMEELLLLQVGFFPVVVTAIR